MILTLLLTAALTAGPIAGTREDAERLARSGAHAQALREFQRFTTANPHDFDSWIWIGRLQSWLRRPADAELAFKRVLAAHPEHVEAITGLGVVFSQTGKLDQSVALLARAAAAAPLDADVLFALGRAHRLAGHPTAAATWLERAYLARPTDPDIRLAHEEAQRSRAVRLDVSGVDELNAGASRARNGHVTVSAPIGDRLQVAATAQIQERFGTRDSRGGASIEWAATRRLSIGTRALFGPSGVVLPRADVSGDVAYTRGRAQWLASARVMHFAAADAVIVSPGLTWSFNDAFDVTGRVFAASATDADRARTFSRSFSIRARIRAARRLWLDGGYALGFESLERPSAIEIAQTDLRTLSTGLRVDLTGMTSIGGAYEWQHGSVARDIGRLTISVGRAF